MEERVVIYPPPPPPPPLEIQTADEVGDTFYDSESVQPKNQPLPPPPQLRFYNNTNVDSNSRVDDSENTYVVQIPKNQIYWIPPPEHAQIIENSKKPAQKKKKKKQSCCITCLRWTLGIFLVLGLLSCAILALYNLTLCPRPPNFRVMQFTVWHHDKPQWSSSSKLGGNITYDMELEVTNPNGANRIIIRSGKASLLFKGHVIAVGSFPLISQESMGVDEAAVELTGKHIHLPREVMDSLKVKKKKKRQTVKSGSQHEEHNSDIKEKKKLEMETMSMDIKKGLPLTLKIMLPLMWETWLKILNGGVIVECEVVVNSLASKYPLIVSQNCGLSDP